MDPDNVSKMGAGIGLETQYVLQKIYKSGQAGIGSNQSFAREFS